MKILMLLDNEFPPDIRVENEINSLLSNDHELHILSYNFGKKFKFEDHGNLKIRRFNIHKQIAKKGIALLHTIPVYKIIWRRQVFKILKKESFDAVHIHDLPLCFLIKSIKKEWSIKVIADMHENYPFLVEDQKYMRYYLAKKILNPKIWHKKEKEWLTNADTIICVAEEMKQRLCNILGKSAKIQLVPNTLNLKYFKDVMIQNPGIEKNLSNGFKLLYVGGFDPGRGIEYLIEATALLIKEIPEIKTILVGDGNIKTELKQITENLGLNNYVKFEGWQPMNNIKSYIENCDLCIIPHVRTPQTDNSSPNKLFQYMYYKKPVIASNCISIEKIVSTENCGLIYEDKNSRNMAKQILKLYNSKELANRMGENGFNAVINKFNWDSTVKPLLDIYNS